MAAPGREPIAVARAVQPLLSQAHALRDGKAWDKAIALYDQALARDPQSEMAARGRASAIEVRGLQGAPAAQAAFVARHEAVRNQAILTAAIEDALVAIGEPAVPALVEALEDEGPYRARRAAGVLGRMPAAAPLSAPALVRALRDPAARNAAARALMRVAPHESERYVPVLISGVDDPDADVARICTVALVEIGTPQVLPGLIRALSDNRTYDRAVTGLSGLGPRAVPAIPALVDALRYGDHPLPLAKKAAEALGRIGAPAVPALEAALKVDRLGAAVPAPAIDNRGAVVYPEAENTRMGAAYALSRMGGLARPAIPVLRDVAFQDPAHRVRQAAERAMTEIERN
jgi:HEAT repeat protein